MKRVLIISGAVIIFLLVATLILGLQRQTSLLPTIFPVATPTPVVFSPSPGAAPRRLLSVFPPNGTNGVATDQNIIFTFNQPVATTSVSFSLFPDTPVMLFSRFNMIIASPEAAYQTGVIYQYSLLDLQGNKLTTASFSAGVIPNPILPLVGRYPNLDTISDTSQRQSYPDVFLAGYVPYQENDFSVSSQFSASPSGHYVFSVTETSPQSKNGFLSWLHGLGLTDEQITRIEIHYISY